MARPRKKGKRATGIQEKKGFLYIVISQTVLKDGIKKTEKKWISTGLTDTPENIKKASESRSRLLNNSDIASFDLNSSLADYVDHVLDRKKREVSDTTYSAYFYRGQRIKEYFGSTKIREISETIVKSFLDSLFEVHHLQERTVKDIKTFLVNVYEEAVSDGIIARNPVKGVMINMKYIIINVIVFFGITNLPQKQRH